MKIKIYTDIYPGIKPENLVFMQTPIEKLNNTKRIEITVDIPDYFFDDMVDLKLFPESVKELK